MRVLVCGGRDYRDHVYNYLDGLHARCHIDPLIHGASSGADGLAADWANERGVEDEPYPAKWAEHTRRCHPCCTKTRHPSAGPIRNQRMLDEGCPDFVVAFPGGRGTADMLKRADAAGVPVTRLAPKDALDREEP